MAEEGKGDSEGMTENAYVRPMRGPGQLSHLPLGVISFKVKGLAEATCSK